MTIEEKRAKHAAYMRRYYQKHKDKVITANEKYRDKHKEWYKSYGKEYRLKNKDRLYQNQLKWLSENKDKKRQHSQNYILSRPPMKGKGFLITVAGNRKIKHKRIYRPDHPNCDRKGYVLEHRIVMESIIGRLLTRDEVVHHKDKNGLNNKPENLQLMTVYEHNQHHKPQRGKNGRFLPNL